MADSALDYGEADAAMAGTGGSEWDLPAATRYDEEEGRSSTHDVPMPMHMDNKANNGTSEGQSKHVSPRMYRFPDTLAVAAGANRGPSPAAGQAFDIRELPEDALPPQVPPPIGGGKDVRLTALHLTGNPIAALSTSRLFAYVSHFGAQPLGVEWINDTSVNIVFADPMAARLALEYICPAAPAVSTPLMPLPTQQEIAQASQSEGAEWPQPLLEACLMPRRAHRFPHALYNGVEKDVLNKAALDVHHREPTSTIPAEAPSIYREMEEQEQRQQSKKVDPTLKDVRRLLATIWVRYTIESADFKDKNARKKSEWYKERGDDAGKQVVPKLLNVATKDEHKELMPSSGEAPQNFSQRYEGTIADSAQTIPAGRPLPPHLSQGQSRRGRRQDGDLLRFGIRRSASPVRGRDAMPDEGGRARGRPQVSRADLDEEMDRYLAGRNGKAPTAPDSLNANATAPRSYMSQWAAEDANPAAISSSPRHASSGTAMPAENGKSSSGAVRVRGRGQHKAPGGKSGMSGWGAREEGDQHSGSGNESLASVSGGGAYLSDMDMDNGGAYQSHRSNASSREGRRKGRGDSNWQDRQYETAGNGEHGDASLAQRLGNEPGGQTLQQRLGQESAANSLAERLSGWD